MRYFKAIYFPLCPACGNKCCKVALKKKERKKENLFVFGFVASGLCCFRGFSQLAVSKGYPVVTVHELVILVDSLVAMRGLCVFAQ